MHLFCPNCQASFPGTARCPRCEGRLVTPAEAFESKAERIPPPPDLVRPAALSRVGVGCVVALGMYLGLREWAGAVLGVLSTENVWDQPAGQVLSDGLRAVGLLAGGLLAGAGRPRGIATGFAVGMVFVALFGAVEVASGSTLGLVDAIIASGLLVLAAVAGWIGGRAWPPVVELPAPAARSRGSSLLKLAQEEREDRTTRPILWVQVLFAATMAVLAVAVADYVREGLRKGASSVLNVGGTPQAPMVDLQLAGLAIVLAGIYAGSGTGAGVRHGLIAGVIAGLGVVGLLVGGVESAAPVAEGVLRLFDLPASNPTGTIGKVVAFAALIAGCTAGGWLGGQLLPPLAPPWMRTRLAPLS